MYLAVVSERIIGAEVPVAEESQGSSASGKSCFHVSECMCSLCSIGLMGLNFPALFTTTAFATG